MREREREGKNHRPRNDSPLSNQLIPSFLSFLFLGSFFFLSVWRKEAKGRHRGTARGGGGFLEKEGGERSVEEGVGRRVGKAAGGKSAFVGHLRRSSISDKNKVNGEWGWRRGWGGGEWGREWMLLRTGPYQSERGEAKSTRRSMLTGHTMKTLPLYTFPSFHYHFSPPFLSHYTLQTPPEKIQLYCIRS